MYPLIESIKLLNGEFYNLQYHELRMKDSLMKLYGYSSMIELQEVLETHNHPNNGLFKCRIVYNVDLFEVEYIPYVHTSPKSLKVVEANTITYEHKSSHRVDIDKLLDHREENDDVIIAKNGLVTDSSYANLLFRQGNCWYTPSKPLLRGTKRAELLDKGLIKEKEIPLQDVTQYESIKLINAMRGLEQEEIDVSNIVF